MELNAYITWTDAAKPLVGQASDVMRGVEVLIAHQCFNDAIQLMGHSLIKRQAIQWGYQCLLSVADQETDVATHDILSMVREWQQSPSETIRYNMQEKAAAQDYKTAASWLAMAVFWSEGSINPPDQLIVPAQEHLSACAVAGAVSLAAVQCHPEQANEKYQRFLQQGLVLLKQSKPSQHRSD